jgi:hypothetical protein
MDKIWTSNKNNCLFVCIRLTPIPCGRGVHADDQRDARPDQTTPSMNSFRFLRSSWLNCRDNHQIVAADLNTATMHMPRATRAIRTYGLVVTDWLDLDLTQEEWPSGRIRSDTETHRACYLAISRAPCKKLSKYSTTSSTVKRSSVCTRLVA